MSEPMTQDRKDVLMLSARCRNYDRELQKQRKRTDKMREAVAAYLAGEISRKRLERVFNDTDYSFVAVE